MKKQIKAIIGILLIALTIPTANAGPLKFVRKNPILTAVGIGAALYLKSPSHKADELSYDPSKAVPFFQSYPQYYNPISQYVLNALAHPDNKKSYDRYKKLAEVMGLNNIPPYEPKFDNAAINNQNPIMEQNRDTLIIENPIQLTDNSNLLISPQGERIDTSTQFPLEKPATWEEYLLLKQDSTILGNNLDSWYKTNNPNWIKPDNVAAHHLIPVKDKEAQLARDILAGYGININDPINGVYLPTKSNTNLNQGIEHNGRHPKSYGSSVNDLISSADIRGGKQEVIQELTNIRGKLESAQRNSNWRNVL